MFGLEIKFNESSEAENSNTIARKFIMQCTARQLQSLFVT